MVWWRPTLWLEPDRATMRSRKGVVVADLSWEGFGSTWQLGPVFASRVNRAAILLALPPLDVAPAPGARRTQFLMPSTWSTPPLWELPALAEYLSAMPAARPGLADPVRASALLAALASKEWKRPAPVGRPLLGDKLDMFVAVERSLNDFGWHRIGGRPVRGEPRPAVADVVERARLLMLPGVAARVTDAQLVAMVEHHYTTATWPFDTLLDGAA